MMKRSTADPSPDVRHLLDRPTALAPLRRHNDRSRHPKPGMMLERE